MSVPHFSLSSPLALLNFRSYRPLAMSTVPKAVQKCEQLTEESDEIKVMCYADYFLEAIAEDMKSDPAIVKSVGWRKVVTVSGLSLRSRGRLTR